MIAERLHPHDIPAEESVLGSILVDPAQFERVRALIDARDFYREANRLVFAAMERLYLDGGSIDQVTVSHELERAGHAEDLGYLSGLIARTPTSVHAGWYAKTLRRLAAARRAIQGAGEISDKAYEDPDEDDLADLIMSLALKVGGRKTQQRRLVSFREIFESKQLAILETFTRSKEQRGISTGLSEFDRAIGGLHRGDLGIVAARANMGKTWLMTTAAKNIADSYRVDEDGNRTDVHRQVGVFSMEMSEEQIFRRIAASDLGINFDAISDVEREELSGEVYSALIEAAMRPIYVSESPRLTVEEIHAQALMRKERGGLDVILIDYLQLIEPPNLGRNAIGVQQLEWITRELKILAREIDIPVIVLCQLNRDVERRGKERGGNFRPRLSDLRGSGSIEQDADWVVFLYHHDYYVARGDAEPDLYRTDRMEFIVGKVREGAIENQLFAYFNPSLSRLEDIGEDNERPGR